MKRWNLTGTHARNRHARIRTHRTLGERMTHIRGDHAEALVIGGRLDVRSAADARAVLHSAVDDGAGDLVLDLTGLDSWDATGLGVIMRRPTGAPAAAAGGWCCGACRPRCSASSWPPGCTGSSPSRAASPLNRCPGLSRSACAAAGSGAGTGGAGPVRICAGRIGSRPPGRPNPPRPPRLGRRHPGCSGRPGERLGFRTSAHRPTHPHGGHRTRSDTARAPRPGGLRRTTLLGATTHGPDEPAAGRARPPHDRRRRRHRRRHLPRPRLRDDLPPLAAGVQPRTGADRPARLRRLPPHRQPVDGCEIEPCPPGRQPGTPGRRTAEQRAERDRAAAPLRPRGPPPPPTCRCWSGTSSTTGSCASSPAAAPCASLGPHGAAAAGLDAVAADCADLALRRGHTPVRPPQDPTELLYELFAAVHHAPDHRPDRAGLLALVRDVGAVVLVDDLEFGGAALDELLDAAPECAFLLAAATPATPGPRPARTSKRSSSWPGPHRHPRTPRSAVGRELTDEEASWAGRPVVRVRGPSPAASSRPPRSCGSATPSARRSPPPRTARTPKTRTASPAGTPTPSVFADDRVTPLPGLGEAAAPSGAAAASRLSEAAGRPCGSRWRSAGGPAPGPLPALVGGTHADAAVARTPRLRAAHPVGLRYRLAAGIAEQLTRTRLRRRRAGACPHRRPALAAVGGHALGRPERVAPEAERTAAGRAPPALAR